MHIKQTNRLAVSHIHRYPIQCPNYRGAPFEISLLNRNNMSYCQNCGKEIQEEWKRCPFCNVKDSSRGMQLSKILSYVLGLTIMAVSIFSYFYFTRNDPIDNWDTGNILMVASIFGLPFSFGLAIFLNARMK